MIDNPIESWIFHAVGEISVAVKYLQRRNFIDLDVVNGVFPRLADDRPLFSTLDTRENSKKHFHRAFFVPIEKRYWKCYLPTLGISTRKSLLDFCTKRKRIRLTTQIFIHRLSHTYRIYILKFTSKTNTDLLYFYFYYPFHYTFFLFEHVFLSFLWQFFDRTWTNVRYISFEKYHLIISFVVVHCIINALYIRCDIGSDDKKLYKYRCTPRTSRTSTHIYVPFFQIIEICTHLETSYNRRLTAACPIQIRL